MSRQNDHAYAEAKALYRSLLDEYAEAVQTRAPSLENTFALVEQAWERLREFGRAEAAASRDMYLVSTFSFAIEAGHIAEAERIYARMGDDYRHAVDAVDALRLGPVKMKIWGRE